MRRLAFGALAVAMTAAALLLGSRREHPAEAPAPTPTARHRHTPDAAPAPSTASLHRAARSFLEAFLAYEAGDTDRATRTAIRHRADHRLASRLLAEPPRPSGHPSAETLALRLTRLPDRADLALATGTAHRPDGPEPFAFLLARRDGRWLAIAPAE